MDSKEIIAVLQSVADGMNEYATIRSGGNLGTTVEGFAIRDGLSQIATAI